MANVHIETLIERCEMTLIELMGARFNPKNWLRSATVFVLFTCYCSDFFIYGNPDGFGKEVRLTFMVSDFCIPSVKFDEIVGYSLCIGVGRWGGKEVGLDSVSDELLCCGECVLRPKINVRKSDKQVDMPIFSMQSPGIYNPGIPLYSGWTMIGIKSH